uniref:EFHB C-terminal EF-hand domain-containing protein n=1 Tax=Globisporangium ultimum (strain ATCC 200006 / CBS 805.95 / DAOM BR144) TaxID=431595 RepID=K3WNW0_GLOUD
MSLSRNPPPRAAGKILDPKLNDSSASCLTFEARPVTPDEVRRYRKSYFVEPGSRIAHPGIINDLKQIDPLTKFGVTTTGSHHVPDVLANAPATEYQRIALARSEANYASQKREVLGKSYSRGHVLPANMQKPDYAFGISGTFGDSARELLYPSTLFNNKQDEELYKRSHGSVAPGEQKNRDYHWDAAKIDPKKYRFGVKTGAIGIEGLGASACLNPEMDDTLPRSVITAKQVEDMRSTFDYLGKPRHLGASSNLPPDHVFGAPLKKDTESTWDCIQGHYSYDEQQPNADLGRAVNYGWKNSSAETRAFGVPSIRSDIPLPSKRSIADGQNYGDDSNAKELLYPEEFASSGIQDDEFVQPRDRKQLRDLFEKIGYTLPDGIFALIWIDATTFGKYTPRGYASVAEFRDALNNYLEADENGQSTLQEWKDRLAST